MRPDRELARRGAELARRLWSLAPLLGIVPPPPDRPEGISAAVRLKGKEPWIEPCLLSLEGFADEILILDHGAADPDRKRLTALAARLAPDLRHLDCRGDDLVEMANRGLSASRRRWFCLWDADLVGHTEGPYALGRLREFLAGLHPRRYHLVKLAAAELAGDLSHRLPEVRRRFDVQVLTAGPRARYVWRDHQYRPAELPRPYRILRGKDPAHYRIRHDTLQTPRFYRVLRWRKPSLLHVNVKGAREMLLRHFWLEWLASDGGLDLEAFARARIRERWGTTSLEEAERRFVREYCRHLEPADPAEFGGYPRPLEPYLQDPGFRVLYEAGKVVGRAEATVSPAGTGPC